MAIKTQRDRKIIADVLRVIDVAHPNNRASPEVREMLKDKHLRIYLHSWAIKPLRSLIEKEE